MSYTTRQVLLFYCFLTLKSAWSIHERGTVLGVLSGYWTLDSPQQRDESFVEDDESFDIVDGKYTFSQCYIIEENGNDTFVIDPALVISRNDLDVHTSQDRYQQVFLREEYTYETCKCSCYHQRAFNQDDPFCHETGSSSHIWNEPYCYDGGHDGFWCNRNFNPPFGNYANRNRFHISGYSNLHQSIYHFEVTATKHRPSITLK